jgi:cell division protein FtsB
MTIEAVVTAIKDALDEAETLAGVPLTTNQVAVLTAANDQLVAERGALLAENAALKATAVQVDALAKQIDALNPDA